MISTYQGLIATKALLSHIHHDCTHYGFLQRIRRRFSAIHRQQLIIETGPSIIYRSSVTVSNNETYGRAAVAKTMCHGVVHDPNLFLKGSC